ncbi:MAG: hypothetical protein O7F73_17180 [Gammaproteobacteria bacterium]|nr:hypothetical protein [Gammaproteobacteria bacterium]
MNTKTLFTLAASFNWLIALALATIPGPLFSLFMVSPLPREPLPMHLFAGLVFVFGIGYYWVSRNFETNIPIVKLGIVGKLSVVAVGLLEVLLGNISWQFMLLVSVDLVFATLFILALQSAPASVLEEV